jgi:hypothetical protein
MDLPLSSIKVIGQPGGVAERIPSLESERQSDALSKKVGDRFIQDADRLSRGAKRFKTKGQLSAR